MEQGETFTGNEGAGPGIVGEKDTFCPICKEPVKKVVESDRDGASDCENEYYRHSGEKLIKFKTPKGAWENLAHVETR